MRTRKQTVSRTPDGLTKINIIRPHIRPWISQTIELQRTRLSTAVLMKQMVTTMKSIRYPICSTLIRIPMTRELKNPGMSG